MTDTNREVAVGRRLEYFTLGWNALEAIIAVAAGIFAGSTALVGFGIDSVIESLSGAVLLWRLRDGKRGEQRERRALKLVGVSFLALAGYVGYEATENLIKQEPPEVSYVGIGLAIASVIAPQFLPEGMIALQGARPVPTGSPAQPRLRPYQ